MSAKQPRITTTPGRLIVISGPSGVGKDTVLRELFRIDPQLRYSVSYTTRPPRTDEIDGTSYSFVDEETFRDMAENKEFLEYANVHGQHYGTSQRRIQDALDRGEDIVLKIDVQGAKWIRAEGRIAGAVFLFLLPPSMEELRRRLTERDTESAEDQALRWANAEIELAEQDAYDHRVVNDDVKRAAGEILAIVDRSRQVGAPG
ncbi:MAG: guanylate kinase [Candidatus Dormibacteria bacterium]